MISSFSELYNNICTGNGTYCWLSDIKYELRRIHQTTLVLSPKIYKSLLFRFSTSCSIENEVLLAYIRIQIVKERNNKLSKV